MKAFKNFRLTILCTTLLLINLSNLQGQTKSKKSALGYAEASYLTLSDNEFMKRWLILGPVKIEESGVKPDDIKQKEFFDKDDLISVAVQPNKILTKVKIGNSEYSWKSFKSEEGTIDFIKQFGQLNYSVAYALAEIKMKAPETVTIGLGSDDAVKLFLNGKLVHKNWIGRATNPDDDILILDLKKGSNQILVKIQNMEYDWSFTMRKLGKDILSKLLIESSGKGNLDNVKLLIDKGADVNVQNDLGLTAYQSAMIKGREKVMNYLKEKGAKTDNPMPSLDKLVDRIFKSVQTGTTSGVSVLVSKNGEIIYEKGFGYADIGNKVPVTPDTKFRIGSITKQFIAASILKLQEEGKLNVHDTLSKFIPDFPRGNKVTIHHLLTHTSGIHSYTDRPNFMRYITMPVTPAALVDTIKTYPYDFNPGDRWNYSNSGFFLLGYIVEKISGMSLDNYLKETFFKPLGMNNTGIYETKTLLNNEAYGYSYENGKIIKAINWDMSWAGGAGAIYSTTKDLYIWNEAIFNGKVLSEASLKAAFTPAELNNKQKTNYGYGWFIQDNRGSKFIAHGGGLHGFMTYLGRQPEKNITVVVFCNSTPAPAGIDPGANSASIAEYLLWSDMTKQPSFASDISVDENTLKNYVGRYNYGQGAVLTVTLEGKQLYAQMTGQARYPIYPSSNDEFNWKVVEASIKFIKDERGNVTHAIHHQGAQQIEANKLKDENPVAINPSVFDKYVGKYDLGNNYFIIVSKDGDRLFMQWANLPKYQLLPASETEYFLRETNIRLTFKINEEGINDFITVNINGIDQPPAKRVNK
ncbi:serine hydrolase [uncultured Bacteroides sp.]|uniref:serine hydrolase n=1 Tax=uncultured Bacteroides sp. TaxID=162156 RepID=UPI002AAA968B|nr:serine hydrolase [uncultured Bacteroides sp.]